MIHRILSVYENISCRAVKNRHIVTNHRQPVHSDIFYKVFIILTNKEGLSGFAM